VRFFKRHRQEAAGLNDARQARLRAQRQFEQVRAETPRFRALTEALRELRAKNNFGPAIEATFRGRDKA
jgi:hypothetical protein